MLTPDQIRRRALNRYPDVLRSLCTRQAIFPLTIVGGGLTKPNDFAVDRAAIEALRQHSREVVGYGYDIVWEQREFRRLGSQRVPGSVTVPTQSDYLRLVGKLGEARQFEADYALICHRCPALADWAQSKPLKVVAHANAWGKLLNVCCHLRDNPRPGCYLRELPVAVETKFIERHRGILSELLPITAPHTVDPSGSCFESRFGFSAKQPLVRIRLLDTRLTVATGLLVSDLATPLDLFCGLPLGGHVVLIVENEMTFLTLPALPGTIAVYGAGDAAAALSQVPWLDTCHILYWGDLDSHGFEVLSNLRTSFPNVTSVLMDQETLADHGEFVVPAAGTATRVPLRLTQSEQQLYEQLAKAGDLLEQEHISNAYSRARLLKAILHTLTDADGTGSTR